MVDGIKVQKVMFEEKFVELLSVISKYGEDWYREIDRIILKELIKVDVMRIKCIYVLNKEEIKIMKNIFKIK